MRCLGRESWLLTRLGQDHGEDDIHEMRQGSDFTCYRHGTYLLFRLHLGPLQASKKRYLKRKDSYLKIRRGD